MWNVSVQNIDALDLTHDLKDGSMVPSKIYLGTEIRKYKINSGKSHWSISSTKYMNNATRKV